MSETTEQNENQPVGQINYFNVLATSIQNINNAIMNEKDPRAAAENFLTDLPDDWVLEIQEIIDKVTKDYNIAVDIYNRVQSSHAKQSIKDQSEIAFRSSSKKYSRDIKRIIITLLKKKNLLYQTKSIVPESNFVDMHDKNEKEDNDEDNI